jgi:hypothetical protein
MTQPGRAGLTCAQLGNRCDAARDVYEAAGRELDAGMGERAALPQLSGRPNMTPESICAWREQRT